MVRLPYLYLALCSDVHLSDDQLKDLLQELLSLLSARHLPTPSSKKSWDLAILVLVSQRLSPAVLLSQKQKIANILDRLLRGNFGGSLHRSEGLKVFSMQSLDATGLTKF